MLEHGGNPSADNHEMKWNALRAWVDIHILFDMFFSWLLLNFRAKSSFLLAPVWIPPTPSQTVLLCSSRTVSIESAVAIWMTNSWLKTARNKDNENLESEPKQYRWGGYKIKGTCFTVIIILGGRVTMHVISYLWYLLVAKALKITKHCCNLAAQSVTCEVITSQPSFTHTIVLNFYIFSYSLKLQLIS